MSKKTGGPAFPIKGPVMTSDEQGMTLRDYFAAKAMQGYLHYFSTDSHPPEDHFLAKMSYELADAMLEAREK